MVFAVASRVRRGSKKRNKRRTLSKKTRLKGLVGGSGDRFIYVSQEEPKDDSNKQYYTIIYLNGTDVWESRNVWFVLNNRKQFIPAEQVCTYQDEIVGGKSKYLVGLVQNMIGFKLQEALMHSRAKEGPMDTCIATRYEGKFWETNGGTEEGFIQLSEIPEHHWKDKEKIDAIVVNVENSGKREEATMQINRATALIEDRTSPGEVSPPLQRKSSRSASLFSRAFSSISLSGR
jgi:hypothetical protein